MILFNLELLRCTRCISTVRRKKGLDCIILLDIPWEMLFPGNKVGGKEARRQRSWLSLSNCLNEGSGFGHRFFWKGGNAWLSQVGDLYMAMIEACRAPEDGVQLNSYRFLAIIERKKESYERPDNEQGNY